MNINRREFVAGVSALGAAALLPDFATANEKAENSDFYFVHLTDLHITSKRSGHEGYRKCVESIRNLKPRPDFVLMGGDNVFDGMYTPKADYENQIRLYKEVSDTLGMPYYHCMGNHDPLGWSSRRKVSVEDPDLGKKMIMERLDWKDSYYSFDHRGWHFVVLDSIFPTKHESGPSHEPRIGPEQLEWLAYDLGSAAGKPTVAVTHIGAFSNIGQQEGNTTRKAMDGHMVLWDTVELREILERHQVKALLQGHSHQIDEYFFKNVHYITSAAGSGAWWSGNWRGYDPGYTLFHCENGKLTWQHMTYQWTPRLEPDDSLEREMTQKYEQWKKDQKRLLEKERRGKLIGT